MRFRRSTIATFHPLVRVSIEVGRDNFAIEQPKQRNYDPEIDYRYSDYYCGTRRCCRYYYRPRGGREPSADALCQRSADESCRFGFCAGHHNERGRHICPHDRLQRLPVEDFQCGLCHPLGGNEWRKCWRHRDAARCRVARRSCREGRTPCSQVGPRGLAHEC